MEVNIEKVKFLLLERESARIHIRDAMDERSTLAEVRAIEGPDGVIDLKILNAQDPVSILEEFDDLVIVFIHQGVLYTAGIMLKVLDKNYLQIREIKDIQKTCLRRYYRVNTKIKYSVYKTHLDGEPASDIPMLDDTIANISGGGFYFQSNERFVKGTKLLVCLDFGDGNNIACLSKVVRNHQVMDRDDLFGIGVEFINISERDRNTILSYVVEVQRSKILVAR